MALVNRSFSVNATPGMMPPIVHVSEYDVGRAYTVSILDEQGNTFTIPTGTTASIEGTLNGSVGFTQSATVSNNQVSFMLSESMTAYSGKAWCKIKLTLNSEPVQTCAFILAVDRAGVEADTIIGASGFEKQIADAAAEWMEQQGFTSPTVSITPITGGNRVTFTDAEHPQGQSIDVLNGEDGQDGEVTNLDTTLSVEGSAADAKATGTMIADKGLTTAQYVALRSLLEAAVFDTDVLEPSEITSAINSLIGTKDLGVFGTFNPKVSKACSVYSDEGNTEIATTESTSNVFCTDAVSKSTVFTVKVETNYPRSAYLYCGYTTDNGDSIYNAVEMLNPNTWTRTGRAEYAVSVPAGAKAAICSTHGAWGCPNNSGYNGNFESAYFYKEVL